MPSSRAPGCGKASRLSRAGAFARLLKLLKRYAEVLDVAIRSPLVTGLPLNPLKGTMNVLRGGAQYPAAQWRPLKYAQSSPSFCDRSNLSACLPSRDRYHCKGGGRCPMGSCSQNWLACIWRFSRPKCIDGLRAIRAYRYNDSMAGAQEEEVDIWSSAVSTYISLSATLEALQAIAHMDSLRRHTQRYRTTHGSIKFARA